jgi:transmembrane 9 superfamily protein 2/4
LKVNKVTSTKTQIPYDYYGIPFCRPDKRRGDMENLGEVLAGDTITNSPYQVRAR